MSVVPYALIYVSITLFSRVGIKPCSVSMVLILHLAVQPVHWLGSVVVAVEY